MSNLQADTVNLNPDMNLQVGQRSGYASYGLPEVKGLGVGFLLRTKAALNLCRKQTEGAGKVFTDTAAALAASESRRRRPATSGLGFRV